MRLVWVVIPLVLFGIGVQESFAEDLRILSIKGDVDFLGYEFDEDTVSLILSIDAKKNSQLQIIIPKDVWYATDYNCKPDTPLILVDGEEIRLRSDFVSYTSTSNIFKIDIPKGARYIEFVFAIGGGPTPLDFGKQCWESYNLRLMSPAKQISNGVPLDSISCKYGLKLILKQTFSPACVKPETFSKLIERGWITYDKINVNIYTDNSEYKTGQEVNITMKNEGRVDVFFNRNIGFLISDESGGTVRSYGGGTFYLEYRNYDAKFSPLDTFNATWYQTDSRFKSAYVQPGIYTITAHFVDIQNISYIAENKFNIIIPDEYYELREKSDPEFMSYFDDAEYVFVGKLTSKIAGDVVPEFFWLNFDVDEYFKYIPQSDTVSMPPQYFNITTHEGSWQNCILTEDETYLIFATDKSYYQINCFWAVETSHYAVEELREISSVLYN